MNEEYVKDFDRWNNVKKETDAKILPVEFFFLEKEIWWASLGVNIKEEIDGKHDKFERPILVLKKISENTLWALPITSSKNKGKYFYTINHYDDNKTICLSQIRFLSASRLVKLIYTMDDYDFEIIRNIICKHLETKRNSPL